MGEGEGERWGKWRWKRWRRARHLEGRRGDQVVHLRFPHPRLVLVVRPAAERHDTLQSMDGEGWWEGGGERDTVRIGYAPSPLSLRRALLHCAEPFFTASATCIVIAASVQLKSLMKQSHTHMGSRAEV